MAWVTTHHPDPDGLAACVQCGLCLPVCPTFRLTGRETASPRGRLQAMTAVQDGVASVDAKFGEIIDFCLGCRACEPVCPGMVPYGSLLEAARNEIVSQRPSLSRRIRGLGVGRAIGWNVFLRSGTFVISMLQRSGADWLVPKRFRRTLAGVRPLASAPSEPVTGSSASVALLTGCVQKQWFSGVNVAAVDLLRRAGIDVAIPSSQTCCGALAAHDGHATAAERLASLNRTAFAGFDTVIATAAGCSAHLADIDPSRAVDITVVIADAIESGLLPTVKAARGRVVVQDPCHLRHAQRVFEQPRTILRAAGYQIVELDDGGMCCGAAGLYAILQPEASTKLGEAKAGLVRSTGETLVASANPGCEMQLRSQLGARYRIAHPIELYLEAINESVLTTNVG